MRISLIILLFLSLIAGSVARTGRAESDSIDFSGTISLSGAWALYPMAVKWAEEFQKIHPAVKIDVAAGGAGKGVVDRLAEVVDIGMVSREIYPEEIEKGAWWVSVTKDAVIPTINKNNPMIDKIMARGIKTEELIDIWINGALKDWGSIAADEKPYVINVYTRSDACGAAETWAKYLGKNQNDLLGIGVYGDPGLAEAVIADELGIGYNNVNYAYDVNTKKPAEGMRVLPIDINDSGKIEKEEDFYADRQELVDAIASGKYPSPPARELFFVCHGKPNKELVRQFIMWVLTEGQKYVPESGYINLPDEILRAQINKLQ